MAGDFPVTVLESQGTNGIYSGHGFMEVPYLGDTRIKVVFSNIKINADRKLIEGFVETTYDPKESAVQFVSDGIGETFGDGGIKTVEIDYPISDIKYVATPLPGKIVIYGDNGGGGESSQQELPAGKDYEIKDNNGTIWNVDEEGNVTQGGKEAEGGAPNSTNTAGVSGNGKEAQVNQYTAKGIKIQWQETPQTKFAYDDPLKTDDKLKAQYSKVKDTDGKDRYVSYKAVVKGESEIFNAKISISDSSLKDTKIIFKTLSIGKEIEAQELSKTDTQRTYQLNLKGILDYAEEEVVAVLMPKNEKDQQQIIGSFKLVHLSPKTINVTLVPLDEASKNKLDAQATELNKIYAKVGVRFNVKKDPVLDISSVTTTNSIETPDDKALSTYSQMQNSINQLYKAANDRYVLFVTSKASSTNQQGYMRLNGQFGYVYKNAPNKITSHELGHGVFKLEHPWEQYGTAKGTTNLLMDYSQGTELNHLDWKQINDPKLKIYSFQEQSSGEYETDGHYSTVYLVSLMLRLDVDLAKTLAVATENPDTDIHSDTDYELDQTWLYPKDQKDIHSLTGGFHGTDEFLTAVKFLYTSKNKTKELGELLHRFGDSYAHTKLDNITPEDLDSYNLKENPENEEKAIESWKGMSGEILSNKIEPWITYFNYYTKKYGLQFLSNDSIQKKVLHGRNLSETLREIYLLQPSDKYIMYGAKKDITHTISIDHASTDDLLPDLIYIRSDWYLTYVKNLAWLLSRKYDKDISGLDITVFEKMISFAEKNKCSLKGIIDYEIAKKKKEKFLYVPVFYSEPSRAAASGDALFKSDYYKIAEKAVENTKKYMKEIDGIQPTNEEAIKNYTKIKFNFKSGFFVTEAFKIEF